MARITNYTELQAAITEKIDSDELDSSFDQYLQLTESRVNVMMKDKNMIESQHTTTNTGYLTNPADWQEYVRVELDGDYSLDLYPSTTSSFIPGKPVGYMIEGNRIRILPVPNGEHTYNVTYYKGVPDLTATNTTNWLLNDYPHVYLNGILTEAYLDLFDNERAMVYEHRFISDINSIIRKHKRTRHSGAPLVIRAV